MMKRFLVPLLLLVTPAHAQMSKSAIQSQIVTLWPDNNNNSITAQKLRVPNQNIVNSYMDLAGAPSFQCPANQTLIGFTDLSHPLCAAVSTIITSTTGTGAFVLANSPTLITPNLGTPSAANLINATGLPIASGVSGLGTGVSTSLIINVGSTGSILTNGGNLGTPSSGVGTNLTALNASNLGSGTVPAARMPALTGDCTTSLGTVATTCLSTNGTAFSTLATTVPGTGVATAVGIAVGSAGAVVVNGGALGTPSSGVGTNLTALNATNLSSGTLPAGRLPAFARTMVLPTNPTATTSATAVMMGLAIPVTPAVTGNLFYQISFNMQTGISLSCTAQLRTGTGAAPANGVAATGTTVGAAIQITEPGSTALFPATAIGYQAAQTVGTAKWVDISLTSAGGGTCALFNITAIVLEQ